MQDQLARNRIFNKLALRTLASSVLLYQQISIRQSSKTKGKSTNLRIAISDRELSSRVSLVCALVVLNVAGSVEGSREADERVGVGDVETTTSSGDGGSDESSESASESLEISSGDGSDDGSYGLWRY